MFVSLRGLSWSVPLWMFLCMQCVPVSVCVSKCVLSLCLCNFVHVASVSVSVPTFLCICMCFCVRLCLSAHCKGLFSYRTAPQITRVTSMLRLGSNPRALYSSGQNSHLRPCGHCNRHMPLLGMFLFVVYLTTGNLNYKVSNERVTGEWRTEKNEEGSCRVPILRSRHLPGMPEKTTKYLSRDRRFPGRCLNPGPPE
jgi:hypothetical protein